MLNGEAVTQRVVDKYRHFLALAAPNDKKAGPHGWILEGIFLFPDVVCPHRTEAGLQDIKRVSKEKHS
jgi:hypothetical protein